MTKYEFKLVIPASGGSNRIRLSTAAISAGAVPAGYGTLYSATYLPAAKLSAQMLKGGSGLGFLGDATVDQNGADGALELTAATASAPGAQMSVESHTDEDVLDLSQWYVHGTVPGDTIGIIYHQA